MTKKKPDVGTVEIVCGWCGKPFESKGKSYKSVEVTCPKCGETFEPVPVRYCCSGCRAAAWREKQGIGRRSITAECKVCGKSFTYANKKGGRQMYCSDACRAERHRKQSRAYYERQRELRSNVTACHGNPANQPKL